MDIHKPKPWHGLREFLKEYGIIVLGVLTALGLEQAVEAFHWRHEVEQERKVLLLEASANVGAVAYRVSENACLENRLSELEAIFTDKSRHGLSQKEFHTPHPPFDVESTGSWEIALSGQALAHMPLSEKLAFSDAFDAYKGFNRLRNDEDSIWRRFELISHASILNQNDWSALHQTFGEASAINKRMKSLTGYIIANATLGQRPKKFLESNADRQEMTAFCSPMLATSAAKSVRSDLKVSVR